MPADPASNPAAFLHKLYELFGRVVLIPIPRGSKNPGENGWQKRTFEDTQKPEYQRLLINAIARGGNIGVLLGPASHNLVSIDWDSDEVLALHLERNPQLAASTRTRGKRGGNIFLRPDRGPYPNSKAYYALRDPNGVKCGEWRCGGGDKGAQTVIFGTHPDGPTYQIVVEAPPIVTSFDILRWFYPFDQKPSCANSSSSHSNNNNDDNDVEAQGRQRDTEDDAHNSYGQILEELGNPFIQSQRSYSINQPFFARIWGIHRLALYDLKNRDFYAYNPRNGLFERLAKEQVIKLIKNDIFAEARERNFPTVGTKISNSFLCSVLELIKSDNKAAHEDFFFRNPRELPVIHAANGMVCLTKDGEI
jgi:hypothetical protein